MFLRLFLVPCLIVGILVALFLVGPSLLNGFNRLIGRSVDDNRSADQFLKALDDENLEVRYRAASDLAQVLLRKKTLAADARFSLGLADRLQKAIDRSAKAEKEFAAKVDGLTPKERAAWEKKLEPDRTLITYLGGSLGNCLVPLGAPLLKQLAEQESGLEPEMLLLRRRAALFALANLGQALNRFDELSAEEKDAIEQQLEDASQKSSHSSWSKATLDYLRARRKGKQDTLGVAAALKKCSTDNDPFLRELSALASNFWHGQGVEETLIESFLVDMSKDRGGGEKEFADGLGKNPASDTRQVTTKPGFMVQANATIALARRGSPRVKLAVLEEMLDPEKLRSIFVLRGKNTADLPDEALVVETVINTLKALRQLQAKRPVVLSGPAGKRLVSLVDELAESDNRAIRTEAEETRLQFGSK
jgi:hypothetical protein